MFKDKKGNEWSTGITGGGYTRVFEQTGIDLAKLLNDQDGTVLRSMLLNPRTLCDVLYAVCRIQATERSITAAMFGELLEGEVLATATDSLVESLTVFFSALYRSDDAGKTLASGVGNLRTAQSTVWRRAAGMIGTIDAEQLANQAFDKELAKRGLSESADSG